MNHNNENRNSKKNEFSIELEMGRGDNTLFGIVMAVARLTGVTPKQLAEMLEDPFERVLYMGELTKEVMTLRAKRGTAKPPTPKDFKEKMGKLVDLVGSVAEKAQEIDEQEHANNRKNRSGHPRG